MVIVHLSFGNGSLMSNQSVIYVLVQIILIFLAFCHILTQIILIFLTLVKQNSVTCFFFEDDFLPWRIKGSVGQCDFLSPRRVQLVSNICQQRNPFIVLFCIAQHYNALHCVVYCLAY